MTCLRIPKGKQSNDPDSIRNTQEFFQLLCVKDAYEYRAQPQAAGSQHQILSSDTRINEIILLVPEFT